MKDIRSDWILNIGDCLKRENGEGYRISGLPIGYGGSSILYPAVSLMDDDVSEYVIKECFPICKGVKFIREKGKIVPISELEEEREWAKILLKKQEEAFRQECILGQKIAKISDRVVIARKILEVNTLETSDGVYSMEHRIYLVMERKEFQGAFLRQIIEECQKPRQDGYPFRTGGLPHIYTTARIMEQVLMAVDLLHRAELGGYLHGDIHDGNLYFSDFRPEEDEEGDIGFGCLLDFGTMRKLYQEENTYRTKEIDNREIYGTKGFIAPEIVQKNDGHLQLGREADIYSIGRLFLYLLTGNKYYDTQLDYDILYIKAENKQLLPSQYRNVGCDDTVGEFVNTILKKSLAHFPKDRYHSAQEMLSEVHKLVRMTRPYENRLCLKLPTLSENIFTGREKEIGKLSYYLRQRQNPIVISGFGGIGKTELAIEFGRRISMQKRRKVYFVRFVDSFRKTIVGPIAEAFSGYNRFDESHKLKKEQVIYEEIIELLGKLNETDVLIIDNVDDAKKSFYELCRGEDQGEAFRALLSRMNIILTTRSKEDNHMELESLSDDELILLMRKLHVQYSRERLMPLISLVDYHTLTVELCARTLVQSEALTPEKLYDILSEGEYSEKQLKKVGSLKDREYEHARIEVHLRKLFQVADLEMGEKRLLSNALLLPIAGIEKTLFAEAVALKDAKELEHLIVRGWVKYDQNNETISIHPLIHSICCKDKTTKPTINRCREYLWWIDAWIQKSSASLLKSQYEQVALCAYDYFKTAVKSKENQVLMNALGYYYFLSGDHQKSINYFYTSLERSYRQNYLNVFVEASIGYGRALETSREHVEDAVRLMERFENEPKLVRYLNKNPEEQIEVLAAYATILRVKNRKYEAIEKCEKIIQIVNEHPEIDFLPEYTAHAYLELAGCKYNLRREVPGYLEEAEHDAKEALRRHKTFIDEKCVEQANDYNILGYVYKEQGKIEQSIECFRNMYEIRLEYYGPKHLYTTNALEGYALALSYDENRLPEAEEMFLKALRFKKEFLPADSAWIGYTYRKIAQFYLKMKRWSDVIWNGQEAIRILNEKEPENVIDIASTQMFISEAMCYLGKTEEAKEYLQETLQRLEHEKSPSYIMKECKALLEKIKTF